MALPKLYDPNAKLSQDEWFVVKAKLIVLNTKPIEESEEFIGYVEQVQGQIKATQTRDTSKKYRPVIVAVLSSVLFNQSPYFRFPMSTDNRELKQDNPLRLKKTQVRKVLSALEELKWIRKLDYKTEIEPIMGTMTHSRFERLADCPHMGVKTPVVFQPKSEMVIIQSLGKLTEAKNYTKKHKLADEKLLLKFNNLISKTIIEYDGEIKTHSKPLVRRIRITELNRATNGRFWGAFWVTGKRELRPHIKINGNPIVELDYQGMFPRLLYNIKKINYTDDPYKTNGISRTIAKELFKRLMNCKRMGRTSSIRKGLRSNEFLDNIDQTDKAMLEEIEKVYENPNGYFEAMEELHSRIDTFFYRKTGVLFLMKYESDIARLVINHFTNKGIPVLPIHDSFIAEKQHEKQLKIIMMAAYKKKMGFDAVIK